MNHSINRKAAQQGFSLLELMIVLLVLSVMMGAVFSQIRLVQIRSTAEQTKLDMFQESREFMDQLQRDLHEAGYPNIRNFGPSVVVGINDYPGSSHDLESASTIRKMRSAW